MNRLTVMLIAAVLAGGLQTMRAQQNTTEGEKLLASAQHKATVDGDLKGAIEEYKKIVAGAGGNRTLAAQALVQMAECYQKLGDAQSRTIYERVVREFADQAESAALARTRLASLREPSTGVPTMTTRRVWTPDVDSVTNLVSTDGRSLVYSDQETGQLVVRELATGESRHFTNKGPLLSSVNAAEESRISPDGRQIAYLFCCTAGGTRYQLRLVAVTAATSGAPPRILVDNDDVVNAEPLDWSPDGKHILAAVERKDKTNQLALISAADGSLRVLKSLDWRWPNGLFSPDGRYIAYNIQLQRDSPNKDIFVLATDGSRETTLVENPAVDSMLGWSPDGKRILFTSDRTGSPGAWSIGVAEGRPEGVPELVKGDIGSVHSLGSTRSGALYYGLQTNVQDIYIASLDMATGKVTTPPAPVNPRLLGGGKASAAWSPDGQYLAYFARSIPFSGLRIRSMKTNGERELSPALRFDVRFGRIRWAPDGRSILAYGVDDKSRGGLYQIDVQTGAVASVVQADGQPYGVWSADGKAIFYTRLRGEDNRIHVRDLETGRDREIYRPALPSGISHLALSPDGSSLAFVSNRSVERAGKPTVEESLLVMPATGGDPHEVLKVQKKATDEWNDLASLEWTRDGEQLLYNWDRGLWRISVKGGAAQKLLASTVARRSSISVHPDGQRIAFTAGEPKEEVWVMENFWPRPAASR